MSTSDSHPEFGVYVPDVTLAVARAAGSGISGISVTALDGSIAHGNRVRIEAEASYAIGPKDQAAPKWWQMGGDLRIGGSAVSAEAIGDPADVSGAIWGSDAGTVTVSSDRLRHSNVDRQYLSKVRGNLTNPNWPTTTAEVGRRYYQSTWYLVGQNHFSTEKFEVSNVVGTFSVLPDFWPGELVELTSSDGLRTVTGTLTDLGNGENAKTMSVTFSPSLADSAEFFGGAVEGLASGATADIDADPYGFGRMVSSSSTKFGRPATEVREPGVFYTYGANGGGQLFNSSEDASGNALNSPNKFDIGGSPDNTPRQWVQLEWVIDLSSNDPNGGKVYFYSNGELLYSEEASDTSGIQTSTQAINIQNIGMETSVFGIGLSQYWGEIYADNDSRRLYLCDADTVAGSLVREPQYIDAWTENGDGSVVIDLELYAGAHPSASGKYLAMMDGAAVVFEGVQL